MTSPVANIAGNVLAATGLAEAETFVQGEKP